MHIKKYTGLIILSICLLGVYCINYYAHSHNSSKEDKYEHEITQIPFAHANDNNIAKNDNNKIVVMGWNIQNLFDTEDDPLTEDDEYTPKGYKHWTEATLEKKIYNITDVIRRVNNNNGPDIIGFCEVENRYVLKQLALHPNIKQLGYRYYYLKDGADPRGIDAALLSKYPARVRWYSPYYGARHLIQAEFKIRGHVLHLILNHWRSRLGGKQKTKYRRIKSAKKCLKLVNKILHKNPKADIIVLGDFNDNPNDYSIRQVLKAIPYKKKRYYKLNDLAYIKKVPKYVNLASDFDQIIISSGLFDKQGFYYIPSSCRIIAYPFMCDSKGGPLSFSPKTYRGYSDHFPVAADFQIQSK